LVTLHYFFYIFMKVLVACEHSGRVRDAFKDLGHFAVSCDFKPCHSPGHHYQGDVRDLLDDEWDLLIGHPPCPYLTHAAMGAYNSPGRHLLRSEAIQFFMLLYNANIKHVCIENPVGIMNRLLPGSIQTIHPWMFGDMAFKRTCLFLKNLPPLVKTVPNLKNVDKSQLYVRTSASGKPVTWQQDLNRYNRAKCAELRSITFPGIAHAMATQWSEYISSSLPGTVRRSPGYSINSYI